MNKTLIFACIVILNLCFNLQTTNAQIANQSVPIAKVDMELEKMNYEPGSFMNPDKCSKFKKMKAIGIGCLIGGGASFLGGIALITLAIANSDDDIIGFEDDENVGLFIGGYAALVVGVAGVSAGIPLTIIGSKKSKQYCDKKTSNLFLTPQKNGLGLSYHF